MIASMMPEADFEWGANFDSVKHFTDLLTTATLRELVAPEGPSQKAALAEALSRATSQTRPTLRDSDLNWVNAQTLARQNWGLGKSFQVELQWAPLILAQCSDHPSNTPGRASGAAESTTISASVPHETGDGDLGSQPLGLYADGDDDETDGAD
jgi:hypothetical protein